MSSNKRRKVERQDVPQMDVSAISAVAARRRLAGRTTGTPEDSTSPAPKTPVASSNAFSVLKNLSHQGDSPSQAAANGSKTHQGAARPSRSSTLKRGGEQSRDPARHENDASIHHRQPVQFSSFRLTKRNYRVRADGVTELRLEESERFLVLGSFGVRVLEGEMTVAGASIRPGGDTQWIHAPHCHALPVMRTREHTRIELHADPSASALRQLGRLSPLFRKMWNEPGVAKATASPPNPTFQILYSSDDVPKKSIIQDLISPPEWNKKLASLTESGSGEACSTLICGPKSAGKSTFAKILVNRLLTRRSGGQGVAFLDLDPGQPEYTPPGTLSLVHVVKPNLSSSFTRTRLEDPAYRVLRSHALASVSPAPGPDFYRDCAFNLHAEYGKSLSHVPLVINTPGWILGTGLQFLRDIIETVSPSEVIYMSEDGPLDTVEVLQKAAGNSLTTLPSQPTEFTARTGSHLRAMHTMSYFHSKSTSASQLAEWDPTPLSAAVPYQLHYSGPSREFLAVLSYYWQPPSETLAKTIGGMVLALAEIEDPKAYGSLVQSGVSSPRVDETPEGLPYIVNAGNVTLDPQHSRTIGLVLVNGIDRVNQTLQVMTPIPIVDLQRIRRSGRDIVLINGKFDIPNWAYMEDFHQRDVDGDSEPRTLEIEQEGTSEDNSDMEPQIAGEATDAPTTSWLEILEASRKRPVGSKVWRVRRDLGRNAGDG